MLWRAVPSLAKAAARISTQQTQPVRLIRSLPSPSKTTPIQSLTYPTKPNETSKADLGGWCMFIGVFLACRELFWKDRHDHILPDAAKEETIEFHTFTDKHLRNGQVKHILLLPNKAIATLIDVRDDHGNLRARPAVFVSHNMSMKQFKEVVEREQEGRGARQPEIQQFCCVETFVDKDAKLRQSYYLIGFGLFLRILNAFIPPPPRA